MNPSFGTEPSPALSHPFADLEAALPPALVKKVQEAIAQGQTLAQLCGISDAELEARYATASDKLMGGNAKEALADLAFLVVHQPCDERYVFALGLALQFDGQHEQAATQYLQVQLLNPDHVGSALRLAECLENLGEHSASAEAYRRCVDISWQDAVHADIRSYAQAGLDRLAKGD